MDKSSAAFRRTQSLRYLRASSQCPHSTIGTSFSSANSSTTTTSINRKAFNRNATFRSRSSRNRFSNESSSGNATTQWSLNRLTFTQKTALLSTWRALRLQLNSLMRKILMEMELASPKVKDIFYKAALVDCFSLFGLNSTLDEHVKLFIKFFDDLINNLDNEQEAIKMIKQVGQCHAILSQTCGFNSDIWEQLGEITMEKICTSDPVQKTREAGRAWRTLIAFVTDTLRCGFDEEARVYLRRSSSEHEENELVKEPEQFSEAQRKIRDAEMLRQLQELRMNYTSTVPLT